MSHIMKKCLCTFTRFQTIIEPPKAESQEENILILKIIGRGIVTTIDRALLSHILHSCLCLGLPKGTDMPHWANKKEQIFTIGQTK